MPLPIRRCHSSQRILTVVGIVTASAAAILLVAAGTAGAQGWEPFTQLETDRWERRSNRGVRRPRANASQPGSPAAPHASRDAYGPADAAEGAYLDPTDRRARFADEPQTYYPPSRDDRPSYGAGRPAPTAPSSISSEALAPLPDLHEGAALGAASAPESATGRAPGPGSAPNRPYGYGNVSGNTPEADGYHATTPPATPHTHGVPGDLALRQGDTPPAFGGLQTGPPRDPWRGLDLTTIERLMGTLVLPPRSPALHDLWRRILIRDAAPPAGNQGDGHFQALRLKELYISGLLDEIRQTLTASSPRQTADPLIAMLAARSEIGAGRRTEGCKSVKRFQDIRTEIPKSFRSEAILVSGYCAAARGNKPAAGLLAELAREERIRPSPGLAALDAVGLGIKTDIALTEGQHLNLIDYRILELAGATPPPGELVKIAAPALLFVLAEDSAAAPELRLAAGEAAARINAYSPDALAALYRTSADAIDTQDSPVDSSIGGSDTPQRRALLYASASAERTPFKKVRQIRAFLDSAKRGDLNLTGLAMAARLTDDIGLIPEIGWFAETAIEANLAAANYERARMWAKFAASNDSGDGQNLEHWMALIDIADPHFPGRRGDALAALARLALMGRFSNENLHRLVTVLDALQYNVPIPLWEAASRTPQPTGHLPQTGVLSELQDAAKKREFARTVLLAMHTLGPDGVNGAHMIALGDAIRALMRAGLEPDARRMGFEALLAGWPRVATN